jgi:hypothetical protein
MGFVSLHGIAHLLMRQACTAAVKRMYPVNCVKDVPGMYRRLA